MESPLHSACLGRWRRDKHEAPIDTPSSGPHSPLAAPRCALGKLTLEGRSLQGVMLVVLWVTYKLETREKVGILLGGGGLE